jgi:hypothetical protein
VQALTPLALLKVPGVQLVHWVNVALTNLPVAHRLQDVDVSWARAMPDRLRNCATLLVPSMKPAVALPDTMLDGLLEVVL